MKTALVRDSNKGLTIKRSENYRTNADFASDLRANGYRVLKVWAGYKTDEEVDEWEFLNRK